MKSLTVNPNASLVITFNSQEEQSEFFRALERTSLPARHISTEELSKIRKGFSETGEPNITIKIAHLLRPIVIELNSVARAAAPNPPRVTPRPQPHLPPAPTAPPPPSPAVAVLPPQPKPPVETPKEEAKPQG